MIVWKKQERELSEQLECGFRHNEILEWLRHTEWHALQHYVPSVAIRRAYRSLRSARIGEVAWRATRGKQLLWRDNSNSVSGTKCLAFSSRRLSIKTPITLTSYWRMNLRGGAEEEEEEEDDEEEEEEEEEEVEAVSVA